MESLIDTCVWVDYFNPKTPIAVRAFANEAITRSNAVICEPVRLEFLQGVSSDYVSRPVQFFSTLPLLTTPVTLWTDALKNARLCVEKGLLVGTVDIVIATIAMHHRATLVTFDADFEEMAKYIPLKLNYLARPN